MIIMVLAGICTLHDIFMKKDATAPLQDKSICRRFI